MTLKEELEILRGEPIGVFDGDPMDIPCIETSDTEKLCKHPIVSVHMITYNHEPYIRQAIEGVMMQNTDFEFELVIGEDCSQDKTREICFEYQKKYPDKIRVLWWHENVSSYGGNGRRVTAHCRGEFIAFCEGDDYWIDPLKLQQQVDAMRVNSNVSLVFTDSNILDQKTKDIERWLGADCYLPGLIRGDDFFSMYSFGRDVKKGLGAEGFIMTASCMVRRSSLIQLFGKYDIFSWRLYLGDKQIWLGLATIGDVFYIPNKTVVYRRNSGGSMSRYRQLIYRDSGIVKMYFTTKGPYNVKFPFYIIAKVLFLRADFFEDYRRKRYQKERNVILKLLFRYDISFIGMELSVIVRWLLFLLSGRAVVFKITKKNFFFKK